MTLFARQIIGSTTRDMSPLRENDSVVFWIFYNGFHWTHRTWWWCTKIGRYQDGYDLAALAGGLTLQFTLGDNKAVQVIAKITEVSLHSLRCVGAYTRILKNIEELSLILSGEKKIYVKKRLHYRTSWLSPSTVDFFFSKKEILQANSIRVLDLVLDIFRDTFLLSMHMMDAYQAFEGHDLQRVEAFKNAKDIYTELMHLSRDHEETYKILCEVTNQILAALKVSIKAEKIYEKLDVQGLFQTKISGKKEAEKNFLTKFHELIDSVGFDGRSSLDKSRFVDKKIIVGRRLN